MAQHDSNADGVLINQGGRRAPGDEQGEGNVSSQRGGGYGNHPGHRRDAEFEPEYHRWREEQMRRLDDEYRDWRKDRYKKFAEEFDAWRSSRTGRVDAGGGGSSST